VILFRIGANVARRPGIAARVSQIAVEEIVQRIGAIGGDVQAFSFGLAGLKESMMEADMASLDWSQCPAVERVPGRRSGAWVFRDTRMPVATVFENLEAGAVLSNDYTTGWIIQLRSATATSTARMITVIASRCSASECSDRAGWSEAMARFGLSLCLPAARAAAMPPFCIGFRTAGDSYSDNPACTLRMSA